jgi:hypothetical protein
MPAPLEDGPDETDLPAPRGRCTDLELESGEVVIYDLDNHNAWIQSDAAVDSDRLP